MSCEIFEQLSVFSQPHVNHTLNSQAVLTAEQVQEIKNKLKREVSISSIATIYKVSRTTIRNIRDGKTWSWID